MSTADKIGLCSLVVAVLGLLILLVQWLQAICEKHRKGVPQFRSLIEPHIFVNESGKAHLHGLGVKFTCESEEPIEIVSVRLRVRGFDVANGMLRGWSQAKPLDTPNRLYAKRVGFEIGLSFEHQHDLISNSNNERGLRVGLNKTATFFTPLPLPLAFQKMLDRAADKHVMVVANILPKKDIVISQGRSLRMIIEAILAAYANNPQDPAYPWFINAFTLTRGLPDTSMIGTTNDRPIKRDDLFDPET